MMKTSVVLCTYNGEKYIIDLLESLRNQSKKIDEVLIRDDCSEDHTVSIIEKYIVDYKLEHWKISVNNKNMGWKKNFFAGIFESSGDIIFPCDQDDIWFENKVENLCNVIESHENAMLVCGDYISLFMGDSKAFPRPYVSKLKCDGSLEQIGYKKALYIIDRPGCTYAINKKLLPTIKYIWFDDLAHDSAAWRSAILDNGLFILHEPVIQFRRHEKNTSDHAMYPVIERINTCNFILTISKHMKEYLLNCNCNHDSQKIIKYIDTHITATIKRKEALENESIRKLIALLPYIKGYPKPSTFLADIVCLFKLKLKL